MVRIYPSYLASYWHKLQAQCYLMLTHVQPLKLIALVCSVRVDNDGDLTVEQHIAKPKMLLHKHSTYRESNQITASHLLLHSHMSVCFQAMIQ